MLGEARSGHIRLAELVAALSLGIDLGFGQPMEHVLRQCLIALHGRCASIRRVHDARLRYASLKVLGAPELPLSQQFQHQLFCCLFIQAATWQELDNRITRMPCGGGAEHDIKLTFVRCHPDPIRQPLQTDHAHLRHLLR